MNKKYSLKQRITYKLDNAFSRGTSSLIVLLAIISLIIILFFGIIYTASGLMSDAEGNVSFAESVWQSLMRSLDAGTVAGDSDWGMRLLGILITIGGIFILSSLIGILNSGLEEKLDNLRKGRSEVIENGHTLILGWSSKIYNIINELVIANENKKKSVIVVMSETEKTVMEDLIRDHCEQTGNTKIICRTGSPIDLKDIAIVNPDEAKSIIVLSPDIDDADIFVIKSVLALTHNPKRKNNNYHIVAEIKGRENIEAAEIAGNKEAQFVLTNELTARITAQTSRQSGLSVVYTQLLSFKGVEIYYQSAPSLSGKTYAEAINSFGNSAIIGIIDNDGNVKLNPKKDTIFKENYKVIAISEDDDTIKTTDTLPAINENAVTKISEQRPNPIENNLVLGWNAKGYIFAGELDKYVSKGSRMHIITERPSEKIIREELESKLKNQAISIDKQKHYERKTLESANISDFDNIVVLSLEELSPQEADGKTILTLLHLRSLSNVSGKKINIVSEMNIQKNRELAEVTKADDFIISEDIISGLISQMSESKMLKYIFDDLFDADGSEIYLKDFSEYVTENTEINFYTVCEAASRKNQTAIGYKKAALHNIVENNYGIVINPDKNSNISFEKGDKIIVLAED